MRQAALDRLGLEARGGTLISGADKVETACRAGRVKLLIHAEDAGLDGRKRLDAAWRVGGGEQRGLVFPSHAPHLVDGARPRKCGTYRLDRLRRRDACPARDLSVARFH